MAKISASTNEKVFAINAWSGLHQTPDGDTKLKLGEAADMKNFRITRDGNLQKRPGTKTLLNLADSGKPVKGFWTGFVSGHEVVLAACDGKLFSLWDESSEAWEAVELGEINCDNNVHFFGFSNIVYMLNGTEYKQWDGVELKDVEGYRPLVRISVTPAGGGENMEEVNRLCGQRRLWISPDGEKASFPLPEKNILSLDYIKDFATGNHLASDAYTCDLAAGTVTFTSIPEKGVNSYEIGWTVEAALREQVTKMRFSELYNSTQDSRVFIYGDGTHKCLYSGLDYDGFPRADYFPDLFEMAIGDSNTPITALIRHYSTLICFKSHSTYSIRYGEITKEDGLLTAAFYSTPTNRSIGNSALGQAQLVLNSPRTLFGEDCYEWRNNSSYSSNLTADERQAKRISDNVYATLRAFDTKKCICFDDNASQEYIIAYNGNCLVHNYAADAWYYYTGINAQCFVSFKNNLYFGTTDGKIKHMHYDYRNDDGEAIIAYWESGSMSFGADHLRKFAAVLWLGVKPEANSEVYITVQTDRKSSYTEKVVTSRLASFYPATFAHWSFATNRKPQMERMKIKAKKFVFYKLIFRTEAVDATATILASDIRVRMTGDAK